MQSARLIVICGFTFLLLPQCNSDDNDDLTPGDPRCASLCTIVEPSVEGAFDICSTDSAQDCIALCEKRIEDVSTMCAECLLEKAQFGEREPPMSTDCGTSDDCADGTICKIGDCSYCQGDDDARENCIRQVYPRQTVNCETNFRPTEECSWTCDS